jgi:hypothetical protein
MNIIKEAIVKESMFGYITEGDRVFVIKVKGAFFTSEETISGEITDVRLKDPKYYVLKSIDDDGYEIDWSEFIYVIDEERLEFLNN